MKKPRGFCSREAGGRAAARSGTSRWRPSRFGADVAPVAAMTLAACRVLLPLRRLASLRRLRRQVWHPALFQIALDLAILSALVLAVDAIGLSNLEARP